MAGVRIARGVSRDDKAPVFLIRRGLFIGCQVLLSAFIFLPFHVQACFTVESPDTQADGQEEETEHEAGLGVELGIYPATDIEEHKRGGDDNKTPYAYL